MIKTEYSIGGRIAVLVMGCSVWTDFFALIGGVVSVDREAVKSSFRSQRAVKVVAWFLIVTAILFALLWLSEDVPALLSGSTP